MQCFRAGGAPGSGRSEPLPSGNETPQVLPVGAPTVGGERDAPSLRQRVTRRQLREVLAETEAAARRSRARLN
jgi:hypothetical protein